MQARWQGILGVGSSSLRRRVVSVYAGLITANLVIWGLTLVASWQYGSLLATGFLAYTLGLRHAVDADHIAAIDNVTRKLMQDGKRPVTVGLFFALGHSTVVVLLSLLLAFAAAMVQTNLEQWRDIGGLIGTTVSATFLFVIGIINLVVLLDLVKMFRQVTRGSTYSPETLDEFLAGRGLMNRFFRPLMRAIDSSWKMYPLGFLFGLGFDTASEVGLLGLSAAGATSGMPIYYVLLLPLLFTAGMTLADTTDGVLMVGAYGWAFLNPLRKLYYNINITFISALIALLVGTIEVLSVVSDKLNLSGGLWDLVGQLDFTMVGYIIIAVFLFSWLGSAIIYRMRGYDRIAVSSDSEQG